MTDTNDARPRVRWRRTIVVLCIAALCVAGSLPVTDLRRDLTWSSGAAEPCVTDIGVSPRWVLDDSDEDLDQDLQSARELGATRYRFDVDWSVAEPTPGNFDWARIDRIVEAVTKAGLKPLGVLAYTPDWARVPGTTDTHGAPADPAAFAAFAAQAASRYSGSIGDWEIWNEPNNAAFWKPAPDPAAYTRLVTSAYSAIKAVQPDATVLAGAMSPGEDWAPGEVEPLTFLEAMYDHGVKGSFTALSIHPYSYPAMPADPSTASWNTFQKVPRIHDLMTAHGDGDKQIWFTEFGAPTGKSSKAVTPDRQAAYLTEGITAARELGYVQAILIYSLRDAGSDVTDPEQNFGLLTLARQPKPAYQAVRNLANPSCQ